MKRYPSIFNETLAPVTIGPSSSNTCAPARIARTCRNIFGEKPVKFRVEMSENGVYKTTYKGLRSDLSFLTGVMGRDSLHPRFDHAYEDAREAGIAIEHCFLDELPRLPAEYARLVFTAKDGREMVFSTASTGGGTFYVDAVDSCKVDIQGYDYELLLFTPFLSDQESDAIISKAKAICPGVNSISYEKGPRHAIVEIKSGAAIPEELVKKLAELTGVFTARTVEPEYPVVLSALRAPPFTNSADMLAYQKKTGLSLFGLALEYEKSMSGWSEEKVLAYADKLWDICEAAIDSGFKEGNDMNGIVPCRAINVKEGFESGRLLPLGMLTQGVPSALAVIEHSNCSGAVVCIPTGGSCGVVPGSISAAAKALGKDKDEMVKALMVAGLLGTFMSETKFFGALGCQAEIGCATGMAAAALVFLMDGDAKQAADAASMGIQSLLGLVCDSIGGMVQVPCLLRNMTAVSTAATCANAAMAGLDAVIPLEEMVGAVLRVGNLFQETNCNSLGLNCTDTSRRLIREHDAISCHTE